jgi:hypothetical protein
MQKVCPPYKPAVYMEKKDRTSDINGLDTVESFRFVGANFVDCLVFTGSFGCNFVNLYVYKKDKSGMSLFVSEGYPRISQKLSHHKF